MRKHRSVARCAVHGQPHPGDPLLRRLDQVEPQVVPDGEAEPADFADCLCHAVEQLRVVVHGPVRTELAAGLLVGQEREYDGPAREPSRAYPVADHRQDHRVHVLHIDRAPAPYTAIGDLAGERIMRPVGGVGRDHIQVSVDQQRVGPGRIRSVDPCHHRSPTGLGLEDRGVQPDLVQLLRHVFRGAPFARAATVAEVAGVDPDQVTAEIDDLGIGSSVRSGGGRRRHGQ